MGRIIIPYKPREAFVPYHESEKRFSLTVAHRRAGKTVARINKLIKKATICQLPNPRFRYIAPFYVQAKDIAWLYLKHYAEPLIRLGGKVNESELSITLPHNNALIRLYGAENAERMRGVYSDGDVLDEVQGMSKSFLSQIILPSLADRQGWLDASGTPQGWSNLLGELHKMASADPENWFLQVLRASETGILPEDELARQKLLMSDNEYDQEFECSFDAAIAGSVYGKWMAQALAEGRITDKVKHDPNYPVYTAWDLGYGDPNAIWFYQQGPNQILFIDYHEGFGMDVHAICEILYGRKIIIKQINPETKEVEDWEFGEWLPDHEHRKHYSYNDVHYVPHDAANKLQAAGGRSIVDQAKRFGINMAVIPATSERNEIEAGRATLPICWWAETRCSKGLDSMRSWQFPYNEDYRAFAVKARHDWASHGAKAFGVAARVWRPRVISEKERAGQKLVTEFHRKRQENNLERQDPYRVKPGKRNS